MGKRTHGNKRSLWAHSQNIKRVKSLQLQIISTLATKLRNLNLEIQNMSDDIRLTPEGGHQASFSRSGSEPSESEGAPLSEPEGVPPSEPEGAPPAPLTRSLHNHNRASRGADSDGGRAAPSTSRQHHSETPAHSEGFSLLENFSEFCEIPVLGGGGWSVTERFSVKDAVTGRTLFEQVEKQSQLIGKLPPSTRGKAWRGRIFWQPGKKSRSRQICLLRTGWDSKAHSWHLSSPLRSEHFKQTLGPSQNSCFAQTLSLSVKRLERRETCRRCIISSCYFKTFKISKKEKENIFLHKWFSFEPFVMINIKAKIISKWA